MLHIGVDFSITSPCVCFWNTNKEHLFENCDFFFLKSHSKQNDYPSNISFADSSFSKDNSIRFSENAQVLRTEIKKRLDSSRHYAIMMEGYSMGAKGRLFDIGEATGIFKYFLSQEKINPIIIAPSVIKKNATGKGNANKYQMLEKFLEINSSLLDSQWVKNLITEKRLQSPLTDIVDAFFIANSFTVSYDQG